MRNIILLFCICIPQLKSAQRIYDRESIELDLKDSKVEKIVENEELYIMTTNFNDLHKEMIEMGFTPLIYTLYKFKTGNKKEPLNTVEVQYFSKNRDLISRYSFEKLPKREDYKPYRFSQSRSIGREGVSQKDGMFATRELIFNLE